MLTTACGAAPTAAPASSADTSDCLVDGRPLDSFPPPELPCFVGSPTEDLANGLRLYQQERYDEALECLETERAREIDPMRPDVQQARFYVAKLCGERRPPPSGIHEHELAQCAPEVSSGDTPPMRPSAETFDEPFVRAGRPWRRAAQGEVATIPPPAHTTHPRRRA